MDKIFFLEELMDDQMNEPVSPEPSGFSSWLTTWMEAITKPNERTFTKLAASPNAKMSTAFLWVFIGSLVNVFAASLVQGAVMGRMMEQFGYDSLPRTLFGGGFISAICGAPVGAVVSVLFFAMFTGVVQWVAKMFGGTGTFEQLAYVFAAITVPFTLASTVFSLFAAIPYIGLCFVFLAFGLAVYVIILELMAVKGVNQFGWGQAAGSLFLPGVVLFCCVAVLVGGLVGVLIPVIRDAAPQLY